MNKQKLIAAILGINPKADSNALSLLDETSLSTMLNTLKSNSQTVNFSQCYAKLQNLANENNVKLAGAGFDSLPNGCEEVTIVADFEEPRISNSGTAGVLLPVKVPGNEKIYKLWIGEQIKDLGIYPINTNMKIKRNAKGFITSMTEA